jgi:biopolymer transport protein ExbD
VSRKRKVRKVEYKDIELNIMPFIDIFSMLNTFLLFTAVFLSVGILEVQIPFLSSTPPPEDPKDAREFKVTVDVAKDKIELATSYSMPPTQEQKFEFPNTKEGLDQLHTKVIQIRKDTPDTDKLNLFSEDDVLWESLSAVMDSVMLRTEKDKDIVFPVAKDALEGKEKDPKAREKAENLAKVYVYPKVIMGSVMLK